MKPIVTASMLLFLPPAIAGDYMAGQDQPPVINGCTLEREARCPGVDLRGADLSNMDLRSADFRGAKPFWGQSEPYQSERSQPGWR